MALIGSVSAQGTTFTLVDSAKVLTVDVAGYYQESYGAISYPAEGKFSVTLSPVPTNDVRYDEGSVSFAWWENWKPLIKGTVILHKPEGDVSFNITWRGICRYENGQVAFTTVIGVHETGSAFNEVRLNLFGYSPEGKLLDEGGAWVGLNSDGDPRRNVWLSGSYKLSPPTNWGGIRQGSKPATEYLKANGTLPRFSMVDTAKLLTVNLSGEYMVGGWGSEVRYPAEAKLSVNVKPTPTDIVYYYKNWDGSEWYDAWWENNPVSIQGTVVVHKPEGDIEFNVSARGTPVSGYDAYRWGDGYWQNGIPAAIISPIHESGKEKIDFYGDGGWGSDALLDLDCINPEGPQMTDQGSAWLEMTGVDGSLYLRGAYEARN